MGVLADSARAQGATKPNVLLIYTDDHRYAGVHALGGTQVQTPNIDRLAADGLTFTRTYLQGSFLGATCVPSRASLLSGRGLFKLQGAGRTIPSDHTTIGEAFGKAGYHSHIVGKWHQDKASLARSFDDGGPIMGVGAYLTDHYRMPLWDWDPGGKFKREDAYLIEWGEPGETTRRALTRADKRDPSGTPATGPHSSEIFAYNAAKFIENYDRPEPFFMYLAFHAPHDPRQAPREYRQMYPPGKIELPPSYMAQHPFDNGYIVCRDEELAPWPRTPEIARQQLADYCAIISHLDHQIGHVIDALRKSGASENTLIIFAGDRGLAVGCHGLLGKQSVYDEDGVHVPFIISGDPVKDKGRKIDALSYTHDIFPTICDLAGIPKPKSVTGTSLAPVIGRKSAHARDHTYHAYLQFQRAYREGDYKLIEYVRAKATEKNGETTTRGSRVSQLFNYTEDPWETMNLADFPEHKPRLDSMRQQMREAAQNAGDKPGRTGQSHDYWDYYK